MQKLIETYAKFSYALGVVLIISPIAYLLFSSIKLNDEPAYAAEKEYEALLSDDFSTDTKKQVETKQDPQSSPTVEVAEPAYELKPPFAVNPPQNEVITHGFTLEIQKIGINTTIFESYNSEAALDAGVWRKPEYGAPDNNAQPIVLAAHRWGRSDFSWEFREKNLFLNLPDLQPGDEIKITWDGEVYNYIVRKRDESMQVTELADLILFTCIDYESPVRFIIYAERV